MATLSLPDQCRPVRAGTPRTVNVASIWHFALSRRRRVRTLGQATSFAGSWSQTRESVKGVAWALHWWPDCGRASHPTSPQASSYEDPGPGDCSLAAGLILAWRQVFALLRRRRVRTLGQATSVAGSWSHARVSEQAFGPVPWGVVQSGSARHLYVLRRWRDKFGRALVPSQCSGGTGACLG